LGVSGDDLLGLAESAARARRQGRPLCPPTHPALAHFTRARRVDVTKAGETLVIECESGAASLIVTFAHGTVVAMGFEQTRQAHRLDTGCVR
jgi:hypothetical protein